MAARKRGVASSPNVPVRRPAIWMLQGALVGGPAGAVLAGAYAYLGLLILPLALIWILFVPDLRRRMRLWGFLGASIFAACFFWGVVFPHFHPE